MFSWICCRFLFETRYWPLFPWTREPLLNVILLLSWGCGGTVIIKDTPCSAPTTNCWHKQCLPGLDYGVFPDSLTFTADIFNIWILQHLDWNNTGTLSIIPFERLHSRFGLICAQPFSFLRSYGSDRDWISYIFLLLLTCFFHLLQSLYSLDFHISLPFISALSCWLLLTCLQYAWGSVQLQEHACVHGRACDSLLCSHLAACLVVRLSCISNRLRFRG